MGPAPDWDAGALFMPNVLYALRALGDGGRGLLWNPYQNCGQPFFANSVSALLYPVHWLFLAVPPDAALVLVTWVDLMIGAVGMYLLIRELGLGMLPALAGAIAFTLGASGAWLAVWTPLHLAPYAWIPAAMAACERLLRRPAWPVAVGLGAILALALLPGYPQSVVFAYQLIALRVLWEMASTRSARALPWLLVALALPVAFAAVQLLPSIEYARRSIRSGSLPMGTMSTRPLTLHKLGLQMALRHARGSVLALAPWLLAAMSLGRLGASRMVRFHVVVVLLGVVLAFGPLTPLYAWYQALPASALFRIPARMLWVSDYGIAVLAAYGVDAVAGGGRIGAAGALASLGVSAAFYWLLHGSGVSAVEAAALVLLPLCAVAAAGWPRGRAVAVVGIVVLLGVDVLARTPSVVRAPPPVARYAAHARRFSAVRRALGADARAFLLTAPGSAGDFGFMQKSATLHRVPSIWDYEPQTDRRYAEVFGTMVTGRPPATVDDVVYVNLGGWVTRGFRRPILDLLGARLVLSTARTAGDRARLFPDGPPPTPGSDLQVDVNPQAQSRSSLVGRLAVVPAAAERLRRLAIGADARAGVALVDEPPASGFLGTDGPIGGRVEVRLDDPEHLRFAVTAGRRAFLYVGDQYYPGWRATVNGRPVPVLRANHAFRAVEVPAGTSDVEMIFRPPLLLVGAAVSGVSLLAAGGLLVLGRRRRTRAA